MKVLKRLITIAVFVCMLLINSSFVVVAENTLVNCDVNGDGKVSALDVLLVKKNIFNIIPRTAFEFDLNNDNVVNVLDLIIVKSKSLEDSSIDTVTTTTPVTTKATTTTTTTTPVVTEPPTPDKEEEFGVDWEIAERAKNFVISPGCSEDDYTQAEQLFLEVMNSYKRNSLGYNPASIVSTYDAWQTYFSNRFLRHLDRNDVIMHSVLGSRGVCGTTEIITVQKNSMTVWEAFSSFMHSPDHRSAIDDYELQAAQVLITFYAGQENNDVYCMVNFVVAESLGEGYSGDDIEDFEAFLSCEIRLDSFDYDCGDAGIKKDGIWSRLAAYKTDEMRRVGLIHQWSAEGTRWDGWWSNDVANAANIIFNNFIYYTENGRNRDHAGGLEYALDDDQFLLDYLEALRYAW